MGDLIRERGGIPTTRTKWKAWGPRRSHSPPLAGDRDESPPTEIIFHITSELYQNQDDDSSQMFENIQVVMGGTMTIKVNFIATIMLLIKFKVEL